MVVAQERHFSIDRLASGPHDSRLRMQTIVRLRWFGVVGQLVTVIAVYWGLGFVLPVGLCLALIAISAWVNVFLRVLYPARYRLSPTFATTLLAWDIVELAALLYLTGGIENPFTFLIVAPVTVSAATLPARNTVLLGVLAIVAAGVLVEQHMPLPWHAQEEFALPRLYRIGMIASVVAGMIFLALYAARLSKESRQMSAALSATEHVLAREQKLHALDGLAAAAAHELGTPLATIALVTKELERDTESMPQIQEDIALLRAQAERCREILRKLTRRPSEQDPHHVSLPVTQLIQEAAAPYQTLSAKVEISARAVAGTEGAGAREPVGERKPGVIYGLGNLIENAVDFARERVEITARWNEREVVVAISDDGPGFSSEIMDTLGDPYVTTRSSREAQTDDNEEASGLGLGFFIAKTLLERSGARLSLENREAPAHGAIVRITWPREAFDLRQADVFTFLPKARAAAE
ncbi:MAG TPA: ActS/PrrB/RegB family redox-sensitive histidine kinase [Hyphomicrobiaceae bacterium]|nr:ActS/PrrB/RegB family redox-sensitive histidine kinase [Hyphomicrobiaceae bacterium]